MCKSMTTGNRYGAIFSNLLSESDQERLLPGMVEQQTIMDSDQHTLRGKPRKIWVFLLNR